MKNWTRIVVLLVLSVLGFSASAQDASISVDTLIVKVISDAVEAVSSDLMSRAMQWLSGLMALQFLITNYKLIPGVELDAVFAKFVGSLMWFGACWYILGNGPGLIKSVGGQIFASYSGSIPDGAGILVGTSALVAALLALSAGAGAFNTIAGQALLFVTLCIGGVGVYFATKVILLQLELAIVVMLSPLSFSLLGLNALRDQGIAPFKSLLSLVYRMVIYGILFAALGGLHKAVGALVHKYAGWGGLWTSITNAVDIVKALFAGAIAYLVLFGLLYKSDSIAASLASGSTNLGTADVAGAAMAGAAAGALAKGASDAVSKPAQGLNDFMQKAFSGTGGVGVNNASGMGSASLDAAPMKPDVGSPSLADGGGGGGGGGPGGPGESSSDTGGPLPGQMVDGEYGGTPNSTPDDNVRDPARDAARAARRQGVAGEKAFQAGTAAQEAGGSSAEVASAATDAGLAALDGSSGAPSKEATSDAASQARQQERTGAGTDAGIQGGSSDLHQKLGDLVDALSSPKEKGLADRLDDWHRQAAQEKAHTSVTINTHHE